MEDQTNNSWHSPSIYSIRGSLLNVFDPAAGLHLRVSGSHNAIAVA